jgi:hypothetical protein
MRYGEALWTFKTIRGLGRTDEERMEAIKQVMDMTVNTRKREVSKEDMWNVIKYLYNKIKEEPGE